jgi:hypothetical protein
MTILPMIPSRFWNKPSRITCTISWQWISHGHSRPWPRIGAGSLRTFLAVWIGDYCIVKPSSLPREADGATISPVRGSVIIISFFREYGQKTKCALAGASSIGLAYSFAHNLVTELNLVSFCMALSLHRKGNLRRCDWPRIRNSKESNCCWSS